MKKKLLSFMFSLLLLTVIFTSTASAHTSVKPAEVGVAERVKFTATSPNERDVATTGIRIVLPDGLEDVMPFTKPGWNVEVKKNGTGEDAKATEIIWSGGEVPEGQRDEFSFGAKVPGEATTLFWKAYQTYADGVVKAWDQQGEEEESEDENAPGPGSETKVIDDLAATDDKNSVVLSESIDKYVGYVGLILGAVALGMVVMMKKKST